MNNEENTTKNLWPNIGGHGIDWRWPNRKDYEFGRDAGKFFWSTGQEGVGIIKAVMDRSPGLGAGILNSMIGTYNFFQDTFGKGEKGKRITIPWEDVLDDERLHTYVGDLWERSHPQSLQTLPEEDRNLLNDYHLSNKEFEDTIKSLMDKYEIEGDLVNGEYVDAQGNTVGRLPLKFLKALSEEEGQILGDMQRGVNDRTKILTDKGIGLLPFERHFDEKGNIQAITFDSDVMTQTSMEPDIKMIGDRPYNEGYTDVMGFPYFGQAGFNKEGKFEMIHPSATRPFDAPGFTALSEKIPPLKAVDAVQDWIAPEYSANPPLYHSAGFKTAMGLTGAKLIQSGLPYASKFAKFAKATPWLAGLTTALTAHKAEAPTIVPEGVEVTPENINKYYKILMEKGNE